MYNFILFLGKTKTVRQLTGPLIGGIAFGLSTLSVCKF